MIVSRFRPGGRIISALLALVFIMMQLLVVVPGQKPVLAATGTGFSDVATDNANCAYITYVSRSGIISGFPDNSYRPGATLTRAQAAAIMVKSLKLDTTGITTSGFKDVSSQHWAATAIGAATSAGVLAGYTDGTFRPDQALTRAEGISLIFRLTKAEVVQVEGIVIPDVAANHWAAKQIAAALDAGIIDFKGDMNFAPNVSMNRGELARALALMLVLAPEYRDQVLTCQVIPGKGTVKIKRSNESNYQVINKEETLHLGDSLATGSDSDARLTFDDGTDLLVEADTQLTLINNSGYKYIKKNGEGGVAVDELKFDMKRGGLFFALAPVPGKTQEATASSAVTTPEPTTVTPSRAVTTRFFRQIAASPSRAVAAKTTIAANKTTVPWWKEKRQTKTRLTFDMPVGMCGARSTYGHVRMTTGGGWTMSIASGWGVMSGGSGIQSGVQAGHEGHVDSRGQTTTNIMTTETIRTWIQSQIIEWMKITAQQIDNQSGVQPGTTPQQQQQIQTVINTMLEGKPPTDENLGQQPSDSGGRTVTTPTITGIQPTEAAPGTLIQITGANFGASEGIVNFGTINAQVVDWSSTSVLVIVPTDIEAGSVQITVVQGANTSPANIFTVLPIDIPSLPEAFYGDVTINGNPAPVGTVIVVKIGAWEIGRITVTVTGKYGDSAKLVVGSTGRIADGQAFTMYVDNLPATIMNYEPGEVKNVNLVV